MEFSDFVEFISMKHVKVACQFEVETKEFRRFKKPFVTCKYINVMQWEEILRTLERLILKQVKLDKEYKALLLPEGFFIADSFHVSYKILPKEQSYVNFERLKFTYMLSWIMAIQITRFTPVAASFMPETAIASTEVVEYDPNQYETRSSKYTPSSQKQTLENKTSPEYSPKSMNGSGSSLNKYTPTRIKSNNNENDNEFQKNPKSANKNMTELFGDSSCDEEEEIKSEDFNRLPNKEQIDKTRIRKRQLLEMEQDSTPKTTKSKTQKDKKIKTDQSTLSTWIKSRNIETPETTKSNRNKPEKSAKSSCTSTKTSKGEDLFDEGNMLRMKTFLKRSKQTEKEKNQRKADLQDYEVWNCNDLSLSALKALVIDFMPDILKLYDNHSNVALRNQKYNAVLLTTCNVLTENQINFVCREIENLRSANDRGCKEEILTEVILPEFIIHVFSDTFSLTKEETIERLKLQEERNTLFEANDQSL